jgi:DNA primase
VLEFKLSRVLAQADSGGVEARRQAVDAVLRIVALAPPLPSQAGAVKQELMVTRIAQRFGLKEETVWARLRELRAARRGGDKYQTRREAPGRPDDRTPDGPAAPRSARATILERELLTLLLTDPALVPLASAEVPAKEIEHPGLRLLLEGLYRLQAEGVTPDLDGLRPRIENAALLTWAMEQKQEVGLMIPDRARAWRELLAEFRTRRALSEKQELRNQLQAAGDDATALELLRRLQQRMGGGSGERRGPDDPADDPQPSADR